MKPAKEDQLKQLHRDILKVENAALESAGSDVYNPTENRVWGNVQLFVRTQTMLEEII